MRTDYILTFFGFAATVLAIALLAIAASAQSDTSDRTTIIAAAQNEALAAINFRQGETASLERAHNHFTPDGWKNFMAHMQGFLDKNGAPTFTSTFVVSKGPVFLGEKDEVVHFRVPGTLTQVQGASRTIYRAALEIYAVRDPRIQGGGSIKIQHLEQITCGRTSSVCQ